MLAENTKISDLQLLFDKTFGAGAWSDWEPETIMLHFGTGEPLILEKIYVLKCLNKALNSVISLPEFFLWAVSVCNNEPAEFETINIPSCLEMAWTIEQIKKIGSLTGQVFEPGEELKGTLSHLLRLEGFSEPVPPFEFIPKTQFEPGQTPEDIKMKAVAIKAYIKHMEEGHV
jgi:hypothetical protein